MPETHRTNYPEQYLLIDQATKASGFTMASDVLTCSLLRTLAAAKPGGAFLELGTGTGLSTAWMLDGMDATATLVSVDNAPEFLSIAQRYLGHDPRVTFVESDGGEWLTQHARSKFDYIFADTWHGKYLMLDEALALLKPGGFYIIDDMLPQPNWPEGHAEKAAKLQTTLAERDDLYLTRQDWATGIVVAVKKGNV
ncbi:Predicted O-methyltransferase YrrM [Catalinimonas alkaloidigena]|uniref:Predicted O-methyltransferase YrrM n=1 Tax=Catalinimonas alkaloidigena TaxID=1075417 RepID=A0A1G9G912_9BACT|nr:class I SAM-dependent methyltransferase [Catalinimonas alkaloidigena]SDK97198.1 Predicted O-methyltransferase YrrM [Catalinimonas alkaloidigena]